MKKRLSYTKMELLEREIQESCQKLPNRTTIMTLLEDPKAEINTSPFRALRGMYIKSIRDYCIKMVTSPIATSTSEIPFRKEFLMTLLRLEILDKNNNPKSVKKMLKDTFKYEKENKKIMKLFNVELTKLRAEIRRTNSNNF